MFELDIFDLDGEYLDNIFKCFNIMDRWCIQTFDEIDEFLEELVFFIAFFDKRSFFSWYVLIKNWNINRDGGMVRC